MGEINTIHLRQKISPHQRMGAPQLKRLFRSKYLEDEGFVGSLLPLSCFRFRFLLQILTVQTERTMDTMKNCNKITRINPDGIR